MNKKDLLLSMNDVADKLEKIGFNKEAKSLTDEMIKVAQFNFNTPAAPVSNTPYSLPTGKTPVPAAPTKPLSPSPSQSGSMAQSADIFGGFNKSVQGLNKLWQSFVNIANNKDVDAALAGLTWSASEVIAPLELIKIRQDSESKAVMSQYDTSIRNNSQELGTIVLDVARMQRSDPNRDVSGYVKQQLPKIKSLIQSLIGSCEMISSRLKAGQFTDNTALFQKYIDWGQGKTVRQVYDHALQNNSPNFANNLAATLKANGLNDENSVIPPGFKL